MSIKRRVGFGPFPGLGPDRRTIARRPINVGIRVAPKTGRLGWRLGKLAMIAAMVMAMLCILNQT